MSKKPMYDEDGKFIGLKSNQVELAVAGLELMKSTLDQAHKKMIQAKIKHENDPTNLQKCDAYLEALKKYGAAEDRFTKRCEELGLVPELPKKS